MSIITQIQLYSPRQHYLHVFLSKIMLFNKLIIVLIIVQTDIRLRNNNMVWARKYVVKKRFQGVPKRDDYEVVKHELPPLQDEEFLVKAEWISVDPYLRAYHAQLPIPYDQFSFQVGIVQESKNSKYSVGSRVVSHKGWADFSIVNEKMITSPLDTVYPLPDLHGLSPSLGVGALGMPGATAYFGFLEVCQPKAGETVVVTGAAGAVGSLVGQIAKIKGCRVIGFAGSDKKVQWLEKELGFDKAFNYKKVNASTALAEAAPKGVDCFFDNVGGEMFSEVLSKMNQFGRVSICGSISRYNEDPSSQSKVVDVQPIILTKQLLVQGIYVTKWVSRWPEAFGEIAKWILTGQLKAPEEVTEGFDSLFDAFVGMLAGENFGKAVVKV